MFDFIHLNTEIMHDDVLKELLDSNGENKESTRVEIFSTRTFS